MSPRGRVAWLSAAPGGAGGLSMVLEAGAVVSAGDRMLRAKGRALRGSEPWSCCWSQVRVLATLQGGRLQLLPSAQDPRAQPALPSGERQGDLVPEKGRDRGDRERRVGLARPRSGGQLGSGSGPSRGWPGVRRRRPAGWAAVLTGQRPGLVVQGLGQVLNSEIMLVT